MLASVFHPILDSSEKIALRERVLDARYSVEDKQQMKQSP
jgi:hypothetical protein